MTTEHVSVPRELAKACEMALRERGYLGDANDMQVILSRATPSDADLKKWLADPETVLVWMLRGIIAVPSHKAMADRFWNGEFSDEKDKPSAPRVVTDEDVERACKARFPETWGMMAENLKVIYRATSRRMLESFATSLPAARVPDGLSAWVGDMKTSAGMDYYVCVGFRDRSEYLTPNVYKIRGRAEFDVAEWNHLLGLGPKPDLLAFDTEAAAPQAGEK